MIINSDLHPKLIELNNLNDKFYLTNGNLNPSCHVGLKHIYLFAANIPSVINSIKDIGFTEGPIIYEFQIYVYYDDKVLIQILLTDNPVIHNYIQKDLSNLKLCEDSSDIERHQLAYKFLLIGTNYYT